MAFISESLKLLVNSYVAGYLEEFSLITEKGETHRERKGDLL